MLVNRMDASRMIATIGEAPARSADLASNLRALATALNGPHGRPLEVRKFALRLLAKHGLADWAFGYNRRKRTMGLCVYGRRLIELSLYLVSRNGAEEILDT